MLADRAAHPARPHRLRPRAARGSARVPRDVRRRPGVRRRTHHHRVRRRAAGGADHPDRGHAEELFALGAAVGVPQVQEHRQLDRARAAPAAPLPRRPGRLADAGRPGARVPRRPSTLRRRLEAEGGTYQSAKDDLRRDAAIHHLCHSRLSIAEISTLLGFQEPSAFHRAFKKWTGSQPGEYRALRADGMSAPGADATARRPATAPALLSG
ncbi:helix-turn-helix domain-containing protein [Methylibium sp. T29]|uniref:helix-turn-helix domain-containing protein n=1 Tax=Methylibium sp. T29 TaxID=1430884 RepID=UPI0020A637E1|nr:helix-turn-helix domain-containing protein [Methylibium sp. T29]